MKQLVILAFALLFSVSTIAAKFYPAKITLKDGKVINGFAKKPVDSYDKDIKFKETENGKTKKFKSDDLKSAIYTIEKDSIQEFDRIPLFGKKKKSNTWMMAIIRGKATLYEYTYYTSSSTGYGTVKTQCKSWGCWRDGELAVTILKEGGSIFNSFKKELTTYFSDNAVLSKKIKDETINSKDLELIVKEYNK